MFPRLIEGTLKVKPPVAKIRAKQNKINRVLVNLIRNECRVWIKAIHLLVMYTKGKNRS